MLLRLSKFGNKTLCDSKNLFLWTICQCPPLFHLYHKVLDGWTELMSWQEDIYWVLPFFFKKKNLTRHWKYPRILMEWIELLCYLLFLVSNECPFVCPDRGIKNHICGAKFVLCKINIQRIYICVMDFSAIQQEYS